MTRSVTGSPDVGSRGGAAVRAPLGRSAATVAVAWLVYAAIYEGVFVLSGFPAGTAIRGAIGNALPDALVALVVVVTARRLAWPASRRGRFFAAQAGLGIACAVMASALKTGLMWVDFLVTRSGQEYPLNASIVAWQTFISLLVFVAVSGAAHAQANARRLAEAAEAAERAQTLRARAELSALRAQLNPHFLFNVLHSALGLVRRDPELAERALERLGDLLRYALHVHRDGADWTPLRQEWEFTESYLDLERIRLGDRLQVTLHVEPAALERRVPSFSLQPLVENAVRHGIAPRAAGGRVGVRATIAGDALRLEVDNDGDGAPDPRPDGEPGPRREGERGLGLRLLRDRLGVLYGGRAAIVSGPAAEGGWRVVVELPSGGGAEER